MEIKNRIALAGSYGNGKTLVSIALSELLNLPRAHVENIDVLYKKIYGTDKDPRLYTKAELFSVGLARFHSRIRQEKKAGFISDGSVLNELAYGEARMRLTSNKKDSSSIRTFLYGNMYKDFGRRLEKTIVDYSKTAYDEIYYLKINPIPSTRSQSNLLFQEYFEEALFRIFNENKIKFKCLSGNVESFIFDIFGEQAKERLEYSDICKILKIAEKKKEELEEDFHFGK